MSISLLLAINAIALIFFGKKLKSVNINICKYIESKYPEQWQNFLTKGQRMGNQKKWAKHLAIESIKNGSLAQKNDSKLQEYLKNFKNIQTSLMISPVIIMILLQVIETVV
ncbi:hypothetical protein SOPP22_14225 [Shewanella sp. OPT22]|nr:hypothetical protein SOPP22_14225 [Shewanella sp. OPT22]